MLEMHFQPISGHNFQNFLAEHVPDPLLGVQKIFLVPARLKSFWTTPGFGFNQVGRSEYKGLLKFWFKYCDTVN